LEDLVQLAEATVDFAACVPWLDKWKKANQHKGRDIKILRIITTYSIYTK
jgi:hypothetical protein